MSKKIIYNQEARNKLKAGVDALANAVGATMGPLGRNVGISKDWGSPNVTHDGVTVAKEIDLKDKFENMGAKLVLEAATKTNDAAGDGTTTATIIAQALVDAGLRNVAAGANPMFIRRGLEKASKDIIKAIADMSKPIKTKEERAQVATNSAQDEKICQIIAEAMEKVGPDGVITVEEGRGLDMELTTKEGMNFDSGYLSSYFVTEPEKFLAIKAPGNGDRRKAMLEDIAVVTGGKVITEDVGRKLDSVTIEDLGKADKVVSTKDDTTIIGGKGTKDSIKNRETHIRQEIDKSTSDYDKEKLQERLAKLIGGVAIISVGAATEAEMKEKKYRVEDAKNATQAAVAEGVVPGGGVALLKARKELNQDALDGDEKVGAKILFEALEAPFRKIVSNAGLEPGTYIKEVQDNLDKNIGLNVLTGKMEDLVSAGIIDPAKVTRVAVENSVSVTISIITTDALIAEEPEERPESQGMPQGGMGGMPGMM